MTNSAAEPPLVQADFAAMAEHLPEMAWVANPRGRIVWANRRWREYVGVAAEQIGAERWEKIHDPDFLPKVSAQWEQALKSGEPVEMTFPLRGANGDFRMFLTRARPLRGEDGKITCWFGINTDIGDFDAANAELKRQKRLLEILNSTAALVAAELNLERLVQSVTDMGVTLIGAQFGAFFYNVQTADGGALQLYTVSGVPRENFAKFPMPRTTAVFAPTFNNAGIVRSDDITKDPRYGKNAPLKGMPEGHLPVRSYLAAPVTSRSGEALGSLLMGHPEPGRFNAHHEQLIVGVAGQAAIGIDNSRLFERAQREIAERKQAEDARLVVLRELNHRVKNLFAIAVGMVTMTARTATSTKGMAEALSGRLRALASAHELIRPTFYSDSQESQKTSIARIIERVVAPHVVASDQIDLSGPPVEIGPGGAASLALILHELATNAAKYGSLSDREGKLAITWAETGEGMLAVEWVERGGPRIDGPPAHSGFGADLAKMTAKGQLGGSFAQRWNPAGVEITLTLSLERLRA